MPRTLLAVLGLLAMASTTARAAIVYQARATMPAALLSIAERDEPSSFVESPLDPTSREHDSRVGDAITLAGTDRFMTRFDTRVIAFSGAAAGITLDVELTLYANAGGLPGAPLWSGLTTGVVLPNNSGVSFIDASFTPNITVPDSICFGVAFTGISINARDSRVFGVSTTSIATIGTSPNTIFRQRTSDGAWFIDDLSQANGGIFRHVEARVEAVPGPASAALVISLFAARARRRR